MGRLPTLLQYVPQVGDLAVNDYQQQELLYLVATHYHSVKRSYHMARREYGDHRNPQPWGPRWILTDVRTGGRICLKHFRLPQNRIWIRYPNGQTADVRMAYDQEDAKIAGQPFLRSLDMAIRRRNAFTEQAAAPAAAEPCSLGKALPNLLDHITATTYEDGSARAPGSVTIFIGTDGHLRLCVNDKDTGEAAFVTAMNLSDLLKRADEGIGSGALDWRKGRPSGRKAKP